MRPLKGHYANSRPGVVKPCHYDGQMDARLHKPGAVWWVRWLRRLALALWLASLILPTLPTPDIGNLPGTPLRGAYLFAKSLVMAFYLPQSIGYPLHLLSLASNVLFLRELLTLVPRWRHRFALWSPWLLAAMCYVNVYVGLRTLRPDGQVPLPGVLSQPGYFVWLAAFGVMWAAAGWGRWTRHAATAVAGDTIGADRAHAEKKRDA